MRTYRTDWKIAIIFLVGYIIWVLGARSIAFSDQVFINASVGMGLLLAVSVLLLTWLSYVSILGTTLKSVEIFFIRRTIDINSITEITDASTYILAKSQFRSLYILYKDQNGESKHIELRITIFPENTLGRLIKDLKEINPTIELNKYSEKLMQSALIRL